jgi:hypothetical protein
MKLIRMRAMGEVYEIERELDGTKVWAYEVRADYSGKRTCLLPARPENGFMAPSTDYPEFYRELSQFKVDDLVAILTHPKGFRPVEVVPDFEVTACEGVRREATACCVHTIYRILGYRTTRRFFGRKPK